MKIPTDRHTSTLGPLHPAMAEAPPRTGSRQILVTGPDLGNYRPTDPPVPSTLWIPPLPSHRGGAPTLRYRWGRPSLNDRDRRTQGERAPRGESGYDKHIVNRRSLTPTIFVCFIYRVYKCSTNSRSISSEPFGLCSRTLVTTTNTHTYTHTHTHTHTYTVNSHTYTGTPFVILYSHPHIHSVSFHYFYILNSCKFSE